MCWGGGGGGALTMVSGKAYKGGPMWSVLKVATSPPHLKQYRKLSKNAAENEAFIGATLPGAKRRMEGWTQFEPNDKLSLRAEYIPCNLDTSVFLQCSMFFKPYTDPQIVSLSDKNFLSFPIWFLQKQSRCLELAEKKSEEYVLDPEAQTPDWSDMTWIL